MQKYFCQGELETLEELNYKTRIIKKGGQKYIRIDDVRGKGLPSDWSYCEYFSVLAPALRYAQELANKADKEFRIYLNLETCIYSVVPKPLSEEDKDHDISLWIITVFPGDWRYDYA